MTREITLGISPCPNDTFIFGPLITGRVSLPRTLIRAHIADVEELNGLACNGALDVVKISVHAYLDVWRDYCLLPAGGAIGRGVGPIMVSRRRMSGDELKNARVAIPGKRTTANLLLELSGLHSGERVEMVFHEIMPAVQKGLVDAGVVIHEGRWTYNSYGLTCVCDLAEMWENMTGLPLPLGVIALRRGFPEGFAEAIKDAIRESILYSRKHTDEVMTLIRRYAQEMDDWIIMKHIDSFVNEFSLDVGQEGRRAVRTILQKACRKLDVAEPESVFYDDDGL
ncbi:1,4-dihydroxy-6-naphthoate synthase [Thermodesulforhabdus norvegica]|uniref:1,4-dihydroxy-6-naphtoate synthase n=1 Tax=Thermodesulforhabdus norvegica TaxID=39841 RepID=A0A1I4SRD0_9BACT|nr:1,4-dihydroxy-6-naphthoate synthase [Thermodesulforhabdus norvegica]SFM66992.1 1,4-dihydroxy-6-naphthoate synthase [Thermodesulforhabdus norvegica]